MGGGRKATLARRQAAAEAVMATGGFDTSITNYQSLLAIAKQQGAVGSGARGACKVCGQTGHLTKQCRNVLGAGADGGDGAAAAAGGTLPELAAPVADSDDDDSLSLSSDSSDEERRRWAGQGGAGAHARRAGVVTVLTALPGCSYAHSQPRTRLCGACVAQRANRLPLVWHLLPPGVAEALDQGRSMVPMPSVCFLPPFAGACASG